MDSPPLFVEYPLSIVQNLRRASCRIDIYCDLLGHWIGYTIYFLNPWLRDSFASAFFLFFPGPFRLIKETIMKLNTLINCYLARLNPKTSHSPSSVRLITQAVRREKSTRVPGRRELFHLALELSPCR